MCGQKKTEGASSITCCRERSQLSSTSSPVMRYWNPTVLTVLPCWQGCPWQGLAQVQQVTAHVHPTAPAHGLAALPCPWSWPSSREALRCCFRGTGWDAVSFRTCHTASPWHSKVPSMQGSTGLGRDASNTRLLPSPGRSSLSGKHLYKEIH